MAGLLWEKRQISIAKDAKVAVVAFASRALVLGWMFLSAGLYRKLDTSTNLQNFACIVGGKESSAQPQPGPSSGWTVNALAPWDSVFFVRIAKCGYEVDMFNAFFPLYPLLMRLIIMVLSYLRLDFFFQSFAMEISYLMVGLVINLVAFCFAAVALHRLSVQITKSHSLSNLAVIFFCFNPSSVFYSAAYTEALFAAFTWSGLVLLHRNRLWRGTFLLMAATGVRSNGILNCFFIAYKLIVSDGISKHGSRRPLSLIKMMFPLIVSCTLITSPNLAMQVYGYYSYCGLNKVGDHAPEWCHKTLPSIYAYVQDVYWDVGFLRFYKHIHRWPWLLQSTPILLMVIGSCWTWCAHDRKRALTLGMICSKRKTTVSKYSKYQQPASTGSINGYYNDELAPYIYHLIGMSLPAFLVMHVNVATRFLSSSPVIYWYAALIFSKQSSSKHGQLWKLQNLIWAWALSFLALGGLLFPNFYPWT